MNPSPINSRIDSTFLKSAPSLKQCPSPETSEVAFAGRSNAGKSSVLNQITGNKSLAKVSKTPGRTQMINFFETNIGGRLVDLPGYGYAKSSKSSQAQWQRAVNEYLSFRENLQGLILVMDIRHPNQDYDLEILTWAKQSNLAVHILLNKSDKLSNNKKLDVLYKTRDKYSDYQNTSIQTFSALKGQGKEELIKTVTQWLQNI
jgi:GTP-binding protein